MAISNDILGSLLGQAQFLTPQNAQQVANALAQQQQLGVGIGLHAQSSQLPPSPPLSARAKELFLKRMGGIRAEMTLKPDDFLHCHIFKDTVYVFFLFNGKEGVVSEPLDLFPSDPLITQFRLILS